MGGPTSQRQNFIPYPTNRVVGTIADARSARAAIDALIDAGFDRADIDILHGEEDVRRLDPTGEDHGFLQQFQRTLIRAAAPNEEYKYLNRHVDDVRAGRFVVMVDARERGRRTAAVDILGEHGAGFIAFYGRWAVEGFPSGTDRVRDGEGARRPGDVPSLFAAAWNARDPAALAALFDEDAEFVNVTGRWWHDRAAIRKAHAYGLERLFQNSTLTIEGTRVRQLRDDVAVVHARMRLAGQTPLGRIQQPRPRATIFSFVVHRADSGWLCASAQNTDVVPDMETNILDEDGTYHSANYRTGTVS